jgi:ABC-type phosphate transport system substrate-binding protein
MTLLLALTGVASMVSAEQPQHSPPYRIIVHPNNPVTQLDQVFLQDAFLKKVRHWPGKQTIRPADLTPRSSTRSRFSKEVLGRSVQAVKAYWQQRIFSGRDVPPPEFDSDAKVVAYVLSHEGAVGYVSGTADLGGSKVVGARD